jgi:flagellin
VAKLSSGLRINKASDDAAGLAVRELIRADVSVLKQGARNGRDAISMLQTAEGAMGVVDDILVRMRELAEQSSTESYSSAQRSIMHAEFSQLIAEIDRIAENTEFNELNLLNRDATNVDDQSDYQIHLGSTEMIQVDRADMTATGLALQAGTGTYRLESTGATGSGSALNMSGTVTVTLNDGSSYSADVATADDLAAVATKIAGLSAGLTATAVSGSNGVYLEITTASGSAANITGITVTDIGGAASSSNLATFTEVQAGSDGVSINSATSARAALGTIVDAIKTKDQYRAKLGYLMNRLESATSVIDIQAENLLSAESRISDVDVATEMAAMTRHQVLAQAGISMLSQANTMPQMALSLLG